MYNAMGIHNPMWVNDNGDILYIERKGKWELKIHYSKGGYEVLNSSDDLEDMVKESELYRKTH